MNIPSLENMVTKVRIICDQASEQLSARPRDPEVLRDFITALDQLEDSLLLLGETATLSECQVLAVFWNKTREMRAQVLVHLHEVEVVQRANLILSTMSPTLH
ncbi:hypothetical protein B0G71_4360 [Paraburkholderia sp. BL27I4N3]|uniref:hypothetical protein n=1 Tax=Paraburkholderia sp. BL27I4N3 TaxID=1938805 RepID=UPI000E2382DA|nr:hypothetical protein [Paraburkholderia sp. BL27I4N3]REE21208.1 hypothetical protein B0G71_4360 [Paraburkholderia sp. BL27I4N3]